MLGVIGVLWMLVWLRWWLFMRIRVDEVLRLWSVILLELMLFFEIFLIVVVGDLVFVDLLNWMFVMVGDWVIRLLIFRILMVWFLVVLMICRGEIDENLLWWSLELVMIMWFWMVILLLLVLVIEMVLFLVFWVVVGIRVKVVNIVEVSVSLWIVGNFKLFF